MVSISTSAPPTLKRKYVAGVYGHETPANEQDRTKGVKRAKQEHQQHRGPTIERAAKALKNSTNFVWSLFGGSGGTAEGAARQGNPRLTGKAHLLLGDGAEDTVDIKGSLTKDTNQGDVATIALSQATNNASASYLSGTSTTAEGSHRTIPSIYPSIPSSLDAYGTEDRPIDISDLREEPDTAREVRTMPRRMSSTTGGRAPASHMPTAFLPSIVAPQRARQLASHHKPSSSSVTSTMSTTQFLLSRTLTPALRHLAYGEQASMSPSTPHSQLVRPIPSAMSSHKRDRQRTPQAGGGRANPSVNSRPLFEFVDGKQPALPSFNEANVAEYRRRNQITYQAWDHTVKLTPFTTSFEKDVKKTANRQQHDKVVRQARRNRERDADQEIPGLAALRITDEKADQALAKKKIKLPTELTGDKRAEVDAAMRDPHFKIRVARENVCATDLQRLKPGTWLNDELINFYAALIQQRADADPKRKVHFFSSFWWTKMLAQGYQKGMLARWTKKINIFEKDIVIIPINLNSNHWVCGAINFKDKRFEFYDSLATEPEEQAYQMMRDYLNQESLNKLKKEFDFTGWENYWDGSTPQQKNFSDCGVFTCQTMEHRARGVGDQGESVTGSNPFDFQQENMPYMRMLMVWEIIHGALDERAHAS